jgi:hypothetical protein
MTTGQEILLALGVGLLIAAWCAWWIHLFFTAARRRQKEQGRRPWTDEEVRFKQIYGHWPD